jgi:hypothetical protein
MKRGWLASLVSLHHVTMKALQAGL